MSEPEPCFMCLEQCRDPVAGPCQHATCRSCAESWLVHKQECAYCRQPLTLEELVPVGGTAPEPLLLKETDQSPPRRNSPTGVATGPRTRRVPSMVDPRGGSPPTLLARVRPPIEIPELQLLGASPRRSDSAFPSFNPQQLSPTGSRPRRLASMYDLTHRGAAATAGEAASQTHPHSDPPLRHSPAASPAHSARALALS
eukprot:EG_transcript_30940